MVFHFDGQLNDRQCESMTRREEREMVKSICSIESIKTIIHQSQQSDDPLLASIFVLSVELNEIYQTFFDLDSRRIRWKDFLFMFDLSPNELFMFSIE
jgi:hypothetical protein